MKSPKEFLSSGMRLEDFFEFLVSFIILRFSRSLFFRVKELGFKFIIFVVYVWFVVANANSLLWGTFFNGVSNVRCEDVEHYFGIIIAIETSPIYSSYFLFEFVIGVIGFVIYFTFDWSYIVAQLKFCNECCCLVVGLNWWCRYCWIIC